MTQQQPGMSKTGEENCKFCHIVRGRIRADVVFEDEVSLAFLDHRPLFPGHCLLIPKAHYYTFVDLPKELIAPLFANAQLLAKGVEQAEMSVVFRARMCGQPCSCGSVGVPNLLTNHSRTIG